MARVMGMLMGMVMRMAALAVVAGILGATTTVAAQAAPPPTTTAPGPVAPTAGGEPPAAGPTGAPLVPARPSPPAGEREPSEQARIEQLLRSSGGEGVPLYLVFEEMLEELIADLAPRPIARMNPLAVRRVELSPNLSDWFADHLETQVVAGLLENTELAIRRCVTCGSLRSRVEGDDWVVTVGIADQEGLRREAELLGVRAFLDIRAAYYPGSNVASLTAEIFHAEDGSVEYAGSWRSDATTAAILRTGERLETRAERVEELERRLDQRPYLSHQVFGGAAFIPRGGGDVYFGISLGYRLHEQFGADRRWLFSLGGSAFLNLDTTTPLIGGFVNASLQYSVLEPNLNGFEIRTGPAIGAFFAGNQGNSFVAEWGVDGIFQFLIGAGLSVFYFVPTTFAGEDLGGFGGKVRLNFNFQ